MKLSVITINKNNRHGLIRTLQSVTDQTFGDYELIVIDGLSNDGSKEVIESYSDEISYWISEEDSGVYNAMNKGIDKAKGDYCLFLNSGDYLASRNILEIIFGLKLNQDILYGKIELKGKVLSFPEELSLYNLRWGVLPHQASFIRKSLFVTYGYYTEKYKIASDWEFWLKTIVINNCSYKYIDLLITVQEPLGLSSKLDCDEGMEILLSLFPARIISDYDNFKELDFYSNIELFKFLVRNRIIYNAINFFKKLSNLNKGIKKYLNNVMPSSLRKISI